MIPKTSGNGDNNKIKQNEQLAKELRKPIIKRFEKEDFILYLKKIFQGADMTDMQLISKFNKGIRFLLCVIDSYSRYAWVFPLKDKKV